MWGMAWLDTQGSGAMGFIMFNVSLKLVWPFTLIVSYLCNNNCHNLALAVKMRERGDSNPMFGD